MLFFDYSFLFLFLPAVLAIYGLVPTRARNAWLLLASLLFYASSSLSFLPLLLVSIAVDFVAGGKIVAARSQSTRRAWLLLSVATNLGLLAFFKYGGFLSANVQSWAGVGGAPWIDVALPIGISFYTFQSLSYTIDLYRGRVRPLRSPVDFATFVALFPQLIAGPIVRFSHLREQLAHREHTLPRFAHGLFTFSVGLAKKLLVADTLAAAAAPLFAAGEPGLLAAWAGMLLFAGQIYFDFSGYCDMAIGLGRLFGFELPENFNRPYCATSFSDFWRRWHITLSQWLRDYLYIPLGGNRCGPFRTYIHLMVTMLLGGLWHGASWNFVLWGGLHGAFLAAERALRDAGVPAPPVAIRRALVFAAVVVAWVPFKLTTLAETGDWLSGMAGLRGVGTLAWEPALGALLMCILVWSPAPQLGTTPRFRTREIAVSVSLLLLSLVVGYGRLEPSPFLYFRF